MQYVLGVDVLNGYQYLSKDLEDVLEDRGESSFLTSTYVDSSISIHTLNFTLHNTHLLIQEDSISVHDEIIEGSTWCILHGNHQRLLLHKVIKIRNNVRVFQPYGEDTSM